MRTCPTCGKVYPINTSATCMTDAAVVAGVLVLRTMPRIPKASTIAAAMATGVSNRGRRRSGVTIEGASWRTLVMAARTESLRCGGGNANVEIR